jgi:hypothetical protein
VLYRGTGIIVQKKFVKTLAHGGIAVSKKNAGVGVLYTRDPLGTYLGLRVHPPIVIKYRLADRHSFFRTNEGNEDCLADN